jgi:AraC family transcriptional regulator, regulatory protein of adaptative response / DNA-3-methyladenine glycosylase II
LCNAPEKLRFEGIAKPHTAPNEHVRKRLAKCQRRRIIRSMKAASTATATDAATNSDNARYSAIQSHDARFDGRFFTGVTSTGIYCRPVCKVRVPKRENCRFFDLAAQAENAGFRPCLRCRPELAPQSGRWSIQDASATLAHQAANLLDEPEAWGDSPPSVEKLSARMGVSDRHVRRIFEAQFGVSPLQYLQTRRLLSAKQLLTDTDLPMTQIAHSSGFASVRRFNAAFVAHYKLNPSQLRRAGSTSAGRGITVKLGYRPPYDVAAMLEFAKKRTLPTIEIVAAPACPMGISRTFKSEFGGKNYSGWLHAEFSSQEAFVTLKVSDSLREVLPQIIRRVRHWLDLDADPNAINAVLHSAFPNGDGLRVPGSLDGFELAVRAVLGQQITVAAARTLAQRLVGKFGAPIETPFAELTRLFPSAAILAQAPGDALGSLGIVKQRQAAIVGIAQAVASQGLQLNASADVPATVAALKELPGIGEWTAQYIAMRALRWPDAFPAADVALHKALGVLGSKKAAKESEVLSQAWKPWRSYAVIRAWSSLS